jgi:hypothetical protein
MVPTPLHHRRFQSSPPDEHVAHLARTAWTLFRHGRYEAALSRIREARAHGAESSILSSLERLDRLTRMRMNGFTTKSI